MSCIFCEIASGNLPAHKVYEDENSVAFLDNKPIGPGHTLLIPKVHTARVEDLKPEQYTQLFLTLHRILVPIRDAMKADATTIEINNGPGSGQEISHIHIHVIPRYGSGRRDITHVFGSKSRGELRDIAKKIREKMR